MCWCPHHLWRATGRRLEYCGHCIPTQSHGDLRGDTEGGEGRNEEVMDGGGEEGDIAGEGTEKISSSIAALGCTYMHVNMLITPAFPNMLT